MTLAPVELLTIVAAVLEAGDRAGFQGGHPVHPASRYVERAWDLWVAANLSIIERRGAT